MQVSQQQAQVPGNGTDQHAENSSRKRLTFLRLKNSSGFNNHF